MFGLKAPNLNPNLLKNKINLKLIISKILNITFIVTTLLLNHKTHIKLTLNMYNLFYKFYWREREREGVLVMGN